MGDELQRYIVKNLEEMRKLVVENNAAMRGLESEFRSFKESLKERVEKLEKREGEQKGNVKSTVALLISTAMLMVSIIVNFFKGGK